MYDDVHSKTPSKGHNGVIVAVRTIFRQFRHYTESLERDKWGLGDRGLPAQLEVVFELGFKLQHLSSYTAQYKGVNMWWSSK